MSDKSKGIINKFIVERTDGKSAEGEKHHNCLYFVLDVDHDEHALPALVAYEKSCKAEYPELAKDLRRWIDKMRKNKAMHDTARRIYWEGER